MPPLSWPKATSASKRAALFTQRWPSAMTKATNKVIAIFIRKPILLQLKFMKYRIANVSDWEAIHLVRMAVKENTLSDPSKITSADYHSMIKERGRGWVCEEGGEIVGFSIVDIQGRNIWALFLLPEFEKKGIGKKLHDLMMDWTANQALESVWLSTTPRTRAEGFYRKMGWQDKGLLENGELKFEWIFK